MAIRTTCRKRSLSALGERESFWEKSSRSIDTRVEGVCNHLTFALYSLYY